MKLRGVVGMWGTFVLCAVVACSSEDSSSPSGASDAGADVQTKRDASTSDGAVDAGDGCLTVQLQGAAVPVSSVDGGADAAVAPAPTGGTVVDGTYVLSAIELYGNATLSYTEAHDTLRLEAGQFAQATEDVNSYTVAGTYTTTGTTLKLVVVCKGGKDANKVQVSVVTFGYDATPTSVTTHRDVVGGTVLATYTKL